MSQKGDLVLGIDCSTTSTKAIVWSLQGDVIAEGRSSLPMFQLRPTWHEQSANLWWSTTVEAVRQAMSQVNPERLAALSISIQRESFVPVNQLGHPLCNAILWMDERARSLLPDINQKISANRFHQITGKPLSGNLTVGKIAWLKTNEPRIFAQTFKFLDVHSFLVHRLTGEYLTGWGCADPTGLFDMKMRQWSPEILDYLDTRLDQFPGTYPPGTILGTLTREAASACHLPAGIQVVAGLGDGQAVGLGLKITESGNSYLSLGTGVVSGSYSQDFVTDRAFRTMSGGIPDSYILETVLLGGAYTVSWFINNIIGLQNRDLGLALSTEDIIDLAAQKVPPGAEGLMLVPYWNSVMNPYWDAAASGIVVGWRGIHQRQHLYRAILEGIAFEQRLHTQGVQTALGSNIERFIAASGGSQSDLWCQIIADVTGIPVYRTQTREASSLGVAILAAAAAGFFPDIRQAAEAMSHWDSQPFEPYPSRHDFYSQLFHEVYIHLFPSLQTYISKLTEISAHDE